MMSDMNITSAQYVSFRGLTNDCIKAVIDGVENFVPLVAGNAEYDEIMRQVNAGTLTIQDAE